MDMHFFPSFSPVLNEGTGSDNSKRHGKPAICCIPRGADEGLDQVTGNADACQTHVDLQTSIISAIEQARVGIALRRQRRLSDSRSHGEYLFVITGLCALDEDSGFLLSPWSTRIARIRQRKRMASFPETIGYQ